MKITDYFDKNLIVFLDASSRDEAIDTLIDLLDQEGRLFDHAQFRKAIFGREHLVSTGIGMGVAVPHAKLKGFDQFYIAIGLQKSHGLDWNAIDQAPVRLIFLIAGPDDRQSEYLQILSQLTMALKDSSLRKELLRSQNAQEIMELFKEYTGSD